MIFYPIAILLILLLPGVFLRLLERRLVFHPSPLDAGILGKLVPPRGLDGACWEEVEFAAADGVRITGWFGAPPDPRATLLWCHGNAGNVSHRIEDFQRFVREFGFAVLLFDYRGYGCSAGTPSEEGLGLDARAAYDWLRARGADPTRIFVLGRSLGGAVAVDLAGAREVAGLILESTFTSIPDMARVTIPLYPAQWFCTIRFPTIDRIGALTVPVLHFHGRRDELVPFSQGERLAEAANRPGHRFVPVDGAGHNDLSRTLGDAYFEQIVDFTGG